MIIQTFETKEFVSKQIVEKFGENHIWFVNTKLIGIAYYLKFHTRDVVTINDWVFGGQYNYSGFREPECTIGAHDSQHRFMNAIDLKFKNTPPEVVRQLIREKFDELKLIGLTTIENNTSTWVHCDCRFVGIIQNQVFEVEYKP